MMMKMMMSAFRGQKYVVGSWLCGGVQREYKSTRYLPSTVYLRKHKLKKNHHHHRHPTVREIRVVLFISIFLFFYFLFFLLFFDRERILARDVDRYQFASHIKETHCMRLQ